MRACVWGAYVTLTGARMHMSMCDRGRFQKCEIEDLRQMHLSWGCNCKAEIHNYRSDDRESGAEFVRIKLRLIAEDRLLLAAALKGR